MMLSLCTGPEWCNFHSRLLEGDCKLERDSHSDAYFDYKHRK